MKTQWPHARLTARDERGDASVLHQQVASTRYQPSERSEMLPESYESEATLAGELVY